MKNVQKKSGICQDLDWNTKQNRKKRAEKQTQPCCSSAAPSAFPWLSSYLPCDGQEICNGCCLKHWVFFRFLWAKGLLWETYKCSQTNSSIKTSKLFIFKSNGSKHWHKSWKSFSKEKEVTAKTSDTRISSDTENWSHICPGTEDAWACLRHPLSLLWLWGGFEESLRRKTDSAMDQNLSCPSNFSIF